METPKRVIIITIIIIIIMNCIEKETKKKSIANAIVKKHIDITK